MRVEGANGTPPKNWPTCQPTGAKSSGQVPAPARPAGDDAQVAPTEKSYVQIALAGGEVNRPAVAEAIKLLVEGKLDTPEAARRAAEAMLARGL